MHLAMTWGFAVLFCLFAGAAEPGKVYADRPNRVSFAPQTAQFVRFVILQSSGGAACLDELEVYGPDKKVNLAVQPGAEASASACLSGYPQHAVEHLNDGAYGNDKSWIGGDGPGQWAQIRLAAPAEVARVVFSRDRLRDFADRVPTVFEVLLSRDGETWTTAASVTAEAGPVRLRSQGGARGLPSPPPPPKAARPASTDDTALDPPHYAFLAEEHAWLKTYGRADLDPRLVPYNGRVKDYPRHRGDDAVPLPSLAAAPPLNAPPDGAAWRGASRAVARVAHPYDFDRGPLVEHVLRAGCHGDTLCLALRVDRLLSAHVAVLSTPDSSACGVVAVKGNRLVFRDYSEEDPPKDRPVEGRFNQDLTEFSLRLPLAWFPEVREKGLRVGLGMGGRHTPADGRPVLLTCAPFALAEESPNGTGFRVRLTAAPGAGKVSLRVADGEEERTLTLRRGASEVLELPAADGPIGPEATFTVRDAEDREHTLRLFRYDPMARALALFREMLDRFEARGLYVGTERAQWDAFTERHAKLTATGRPDPAALRAAFFDARAAKRALLLRDPDITGIGRLLFVKRNAFEPSHNYSDYFDSAYRPGGGVCLLDIARDGDRWAPEQARVTELFASGGGIARNPMADFDASRIYFSYRPEEKGYYHVHSMAPDGSDLKQLTDGPFHDLWPCPLPDGDLAVISTRCTARFICWRPQASVLFRMKPDGSQFTPISFANLTEWASSVMDDGRIIWTRSEYQDKGADFGHTLWAVRPDGTCPELVFGNTIIQPNGYANGRQVPGTKEFSCTLISHFGDLNGPIALVDTGRGRFTRDAITSLTPEVPWPGMWPDNECFREAYPVARDYFLCAHAPRKTFGLFLLDRYGNREALYLDPAISSMCPTPFAARPKPPVLDGGKPAEAAAPATGEFILQDVYAGLGPAVPRGAVRYLRVSEEVRATLDQMPDGTFRADHPEFQDWYATPVHKVSGPHGWPTYVAKASHGIVPVEPDGSARFTAPAGKVLYFSALDENYNELQRMRSVVQLQPGETRGCIGCHESRQQAPAQHRRLLAQAPRALTVADWEGKPFSYEEVVQPVLDRHCVSCHNPSHPKGLDYTGVLDADKIPASYRTLIEKGLVHYADMGWNSGGCEKKEPLTLGTLKSRLWEKLNAGHQKIQLTPDETLRIKTWIDLNCPLWPDYKNRLERPGEAERLAMSGTGDK